MAKKRAVPDCYEYPQEVWSKEKCSRMANHIAKDGLGTKYHFAGYIGSSAYPGGYGHTRFNGGTVINGEWYQSIHRPLPKVADGYEIIVVPTWGYRIVKTNT